MKMLLVSQVDGHETKPLKVVRDQLEARLTCIEDATVYSDTEETYQGQAAATGAAFDEAWGGMNEHLFELEGLQFESGAGSWDYLIQQVDVAE